MQPEAKKIQPMVTISVDTILFFMDARVGIELRMSSDKSHLSAKNRNRLLNEE
ncbi:hypothetical protein LEP1GSC169_3088 [Leptospira santarosai str. HAI1349]|nr:hypothetical protein LEP1GSC169_3088 [Leptospira santarosai str. HAI1349]